MAESVTSVGAVSSPIIGAPSPPTDSTSASTLPASRHASNMKYGAGISVTGSMSHPTSVGLTPRKTPLPASRVFSMMSSDSREKNGMFGKLSRPTDRYVFGGSRFIVSYFSPRLKCTGDSTTMMSRPASAAPS